MRGRVAQWKGDNLPEIENLLGQHLARARKEGDKLHLTGLGLDTTAELGDTIMVDGDRLGILRAATSTPTKEEFLTWEGGNVPQFEAFLKGQGLTFVVTGRNLEAYAGLQRVLLLQKGDRIIKRDGQIIVSRRAH